MVSCLLSETAGTHESALNLVFQEAGLIAQHNLRLSDGLSQIIILDSESTPMHQQGCEQPLLRSEMVAADAWLWNHTCCQDLANAGAGIAITDQRIDESHKCRHIPMSFIGPRNSKNHRLF
jgi:hypothetical protein